METSKAIPDFTSGWEFTGLRDTTVFFRNAHLLLPSGSALVLEEVAMAKEVRAFVTSRAIDPQGVLKPGTWWPRSRMYWLAATSEALDGLAKLSVDYSEPEICTHVYVVHDGALILVWHDAFDDPLLVSREIPDACIAKFGDAVGIRPESWQAA